MASGYDGTPCDTCGEPMTATLDSPELGDDSAMDLHCPNGHEVYIPAESAARSRIAKLREIKTSGMCARVEGYLVDIVTANLLVTVYDALKKPEAREKFGQLALPTLVKVCWKVAK